MHDMLGFGGNGAVVICACQEELEDFSGRSSLYLWIRCAEDL